jgi:crotonobetainyl-CoA:carnitine CoA-transferase CaiB-like acyl-CoA transferase
VSVLENLLVVDISGNIGGPLAAQFLADYGAEVIKVEPPGGDPDRARPGFGWLHRGKRSVVLDPEAPADRERFARLLARADVCVTTDGSQLAAWGVDPAGVEAAYPRLVLLETPLWVGEPDPLTEIDTLELLAARTGLAWNQASFAGGPIELVEPQVLYVQGAWAACTAVAALVDREASGLGQRVCVSGVHAFVEFGPHLLVFDPAQPPGRRNFGPGGPNPTYTNYQCADGLWLLIGALGHKFQRRVLHLLELDDLLDDPRIDQDPDRLFTPANCDWVRDKMGAAFGRRDRASWLAALEQADVPSSPLLERADWFDHEHVRAMGLHAELDDPEAGAVAQVASPIRLSATPARPVSPAPQPGADQAELDRLLSAEPVPRAERPGTGSDGPLTGIRVLSLGAYVAGPYSARLLGELGAEVIKIEPPAGDPWRMHGFQVNLGMRGLALDITAPDGQAALAALIRSADVVMDNFRPGVLERLGLDDASLRRIRPDLVTASVTGFGSIGPMSRRPGFDPVLQAISGMQIAQGGPDEPVMMSLAVNDTATAALTALGTTLALFHRARTGQGQRVETSLAATSLFLQGEELVRVTGRTPASTGGRDFRGPDPWHRYYQCADGWIRVEGGPVEATVLAAAGLAVGSPGEFAPDAEPALAAALAALTVAQARDKLHACGVRTMRAHNAQDLVADPVLMRMGLAYRFENPDGYVYYAPGRLAWLSRTMRQGPEVPPGVGEHSTEVLTRAGVPPQTIDDLIAAKVVVQGRAVQPRVLTAYR